ncbi:nucleotidyltransferase domain-containing protein [Micromonospora sp. GCM10011542]|uniref:nucleotidyltransferase domain-containing protein n=1 Tax=Micromonospora sp. GCM10011542 TaxID=3317337 RepID=UPI0036148E69
MDSDLRRYLDDLVDSARAVLGADLVGAYAAGSVGLGAYQPGRSDVDVALVSAGPLSEAAKRALVARLRHEALPCPARGLELVVYRRAVAASGTPEPGFEVELNTGATMPFRCTLDPADRPAADGRFWYALDRSILHQSGYALLGPPAGQVFADPAPADLRRLLIEALTWWLALPTPPDDGPAPGAEDAVLGACRSLVRHRDGVWLSKVAAGQRLIDAGDPAEVIRRSVAARHGGPPPTGPQARAFQQRVRAEIAV